MESSSKEKIPILPGHSPIRRPPNNIVRSDPLQKFTKCNFQLPIAKKYHRCKVLVRASQPSSMDTFSKPYNAAISGHRKKNSYFVWNENLEKAFQTNHSGLGKKGVTPFNINRVPCLAPDWSKEGIGFLLLQKHCTCPTVLSKIQQAVTHYRSRDMTAASQYIYIYIYTHTNISITGPAANHCPENGFNYMCIMNATMTIKSLLRFCISLQLVTQLVMQLRADS